MAALPAASVFLADEQVYRGYCLLLAHEHADHLDEMPIERQVQLWKTSPGWQRRCAGSWRQRATRCGRGREGRGAA